MAPITLFFGANSSGKSSIGQFLMMLKQTVESSDRKAVFYPGGKNSVVQLGSYREMIFHHDPENNITFGYQWNLQNALKIKDQINNQTYSGQLLSFDAVVGLGDANKHSLIVDQFKYQLMDDHEKQILAVGLEKTTGAKHGYKANSEQY